MPWLRLGAFVSAAERFKKIHEWDLVIELYAAAGRREDALEVLNRELEQKPDHPRLLCALGDLRMTTRLSMSGPGPSPNVATGARPEAWLEGT